jgi:GAF domain-containing protein
VSDGDLRAAVAAAALGAEELRRSLLQSIVEVARSILDAKASSIMLFDPDTDELVFEAAVGEGEEGLTGTRMAANSGIAGWVLQSQEPLMIEDVQADPRFGREVAEQSGYVPKGILAVPLLHDGAAIGVLSVLDRPPQVPFSLAESDLLASFAIQAAAALAVIQGARRVEAVLDEGDEELAAVHRLALALDSRRGREREAAQRLLDALTALIRD